MIAPADIRVVSSSVNADPTSTCVIPVVLPAEVSKVHVPLVANPPAETSPRKEALSLVWLPMMKFPPKSEFNRPMISTAVWSAVALASMLSNLLKRVTVKFFSVRPPSPTEYVVLVSVALTLVQANTIAPALSSQIRSLSPSGSESDSIPRWLKFTVALPEVAPPDNPVPATTAVISPEPEPKFCASM